MIVKWRVIAAAWRVFCPNTRLDWRTESEGNCCRIRAEFLLIPGLVWGMVNTRLGWWTVKSRVIASVQGVFFNARLGWGTEVEGSCCCMGVVLFNSKLSEGTGKSRVIAAVAVFF